MRRTSRISSRTSEQHHITVNSPPSITSSTAAGSHLNHASPAPIAGHSSVYQWLSLSTSSTIASHLRHLYGRFYPNCGCSPRSSLRVQPSFNLHCCRKEPLPTATRRRSRRPSTETCHSQRRIHSRIPIWRLPAFQARKQGSLRRADDSIWKQRLSQD